MDRQRLQEHHGSTGFYDKKLLPNYSVFDERRYFDPGQIEPIFKIGKETFGITICEDVWDDNYTVKPIQKYKNRVDFVVNLSASPFTPEKIQKRKQVLTQRSKETKLPILYVNQVGGQDGLIFDGASMIVDGDDAYVIGKEFEEDFILIHFDAGKWTFIPQTYPMDEKTPVQKIRQALVLGIRDYFKKTGFKKAVVGLSGGIDSAVTAALAVEALGPMNVEGVAMPSKYSSEGSLLDAYELGENLCIKVRTIAIHPMVKAFNDTFANFYRSGYHSDVTEQNIQARIRGNILMAISNEEGRLVLSTGNKSEMSVGYCTLYGDMAGGLSVIADVYKTEVYAIARLLKAIPENSITKPPSAELKPDQKDTDSLPAYEVLDEILKLYIEKKKAYLQILAHRNIDPARIDRNFDPAVVAKVLNMVDRNEYKRQQAALLLIVSERDLVVGRRNPIANRFYQF
jgi:NAD+ synthase (glutamine-hydrolysing)